MSSLVNLSKAPDMLMVLTGYDDVHAEHTQEENPVCAYKEDSPDRPHKIPKVGLNTDPFDKTKKICQACFHRRRAEQQQEAGLTCAYKQEIPDRPHMITGGGLKPDPFDKTKKICHACFQKRIAEQQQEAGLTCAYKQESPDRPHMITAGGLNIDPFDKTKKICHACFQRRRAEQQRKEGAVCAYKEDSPDRPHMITGGGLNTDPFDKTKKICQACFLRRRAEQQQEAGRTCAYKEDSPDRPHRIVSGGLNTDPLDKTKKICGACYQRIKRQLSKESSPGKHPSNSEDELSSSAKRKKIATSPNPSSDTQPDNPLDILASVASTQVRMVKIEEDDSDADCTITKIIRHPHTIDNTLPILQDPSNPKRSLLSEAEGDMNSIRVQWNGLMANQKQKEHIKEQIQEWLHLNENDKDAYAAKLSEYCEVKIPVGFGPERGNSIFAKKDIEALTVIGPYSGILRRSDEELDIAIRQNGSVNTLTYAFETNSTKRTIDAFQHGNVTSLINTGNLAGHVPWAENNIVALSVGKNLIFYVAPEKILAGTELLLDYGPSYNPYQLVKQEQEDE